MKMRRLSGLALGLMLAGMIAVPARASEYDPFARDPAQVEVSEQARTRLETVYYEVMPLLGATCLTPREPAAVASRLSSLISEFPSEPALYLERARADYALSRFAEAEADFKTYADKANDRGSALRALADFYGDRLLIKEQMATLDRLLDAQAQDPARDKEKISATIEEILSVADAQALKIDRASYRRKLLDLFPEDLEACLAFLRERSREAPLGQARQDILDYMKRFPDRPAPFATLLARLLRRNGQDEQARKVFLDVLAPESPPELFNAFFAMLREWGEYWDYKSELEAREGQWTGQDFAIIFHLYLEEGEPGLAGSVLEQWISGAKSPAPERVRLWADYAIRCGRAERAVSLLYEGLQGVSGEEEGPWLSALFQALLASKNAALALPGSVSGLYDPRALDPDPGLSGGMLSLLLNHLNMEEVLSDVAAMEGRHRNFAWALKVRAQYEKSFPGGPASADMDFAIIRRYEELRAWNETAREAAAFAAAHGADARAREAALSRARALWNLGRKDEARQEYDALLDKQAGDEKFYLRVLKEYAAQLLDDGRAGEMVSLYWREVGSHPQEPELYQAFLDSISSLELGDEELRIYQQAAAKLKGADWYSRLARFYLQKKMGSSYEQSLGDAVAGLPESEIGPFLDQAVPEWPRNDKTLALKSSLYLSACRRFPRNPEYLRAYLRLASVLYTGESCQDASCRDPLLDFAKHCLMDDHRIGKEAGAALLSRLLSRGLLDPAVNELLSKPSRNAAEDYFLALALDWTGRYEQSAGPWLIMSRRYPATAYFQEETAERLLGLGRVRPGRFPEAQKNAVALLVKLAQLYPADQHYPVRVGEFLAGEGRFKEALSWWDKLIESAPGLSGRYLAAAETAWDYFQFSAAAERIRMGRTRLGSPSLFGLELGAILEDAGDDGSAIIEYAHALAGDTVDPGPVVSRLVYLSKSRGESAKVDAAFASLFAERPAAAAPVRAYAEYLTRMEREAEIAPVLDQAAKRISDTDFLAWARETLKRTGPAAAEERVLLRIIALRPADPEARLELAQFYRRQGKTQDMLTAAAAMKAQVLNLSRPAARLGWLNALADELWEARQRDPALELLRAALPLTSGPDRKSAGLLLIHRLAELKEYTEAGMVLDSLLGSSGFDPDVFNELARIQTLRSDRQALIELDRRMKTMIENSPALGRSEKSDALAEVHRRVAEGLAECGNAPEALDYFIEWINLRPSETERLRETWIFAARSGQTDRLLKYYRAEAEKADKDFRWSWVLARFLAWKGDRDGAVGAYRAAIRNEPDAPALYRELAPLFIGQDDFAAAARNYAKLASIDRSGEDWARRAARAYFLAGDTIKAMSIIRKMTEQGSSFRRFFEAARALAESGRFGEARPFLEQGEEEFLRRADREVLGQDDLRDLVGIRARAGEPAVAFKELIKLHARLSELAQNPDNKYVKWRLDSSRRNIETVVSSVLPEALREFGSAADFEAVAKALDRGAKDLTLPAPALFALANGAGLADQAERLLPLAHLQKEQMDSSVNVPDMESFLRERGEWEKLLEDSNVNSYEKAQAALWLGREGEAASLLSSIYHKDRASLDPGDMEFLDLIAEPGRADLARRFLDDGRFVEDEANYYIERGRLDLAERALKSYPEPAWSLTKRLLLRLAAKDYGKAFDREAEGLLRLWSIGERLDTPWDKSSQLYGHEQAVMEMKYAELLARGGRQDQAADLWDAAPEDRPRSSQACRFAGQILYLAGDNEGAQARFRRALTLAPDDNPSRRGTALTLLKRGDRDGALALLESIAGDTAAPSEWETAKRYQFDALLAAGLEKEAMDRLAAWIRFTYPRDKWTAADALAALCRQARLSKSREEEEAAAALLRELLAGDSDDTALAAQAIDEGWLDPADLGFAYDHMVMALAGRESREDEFKDWEDRRLDYWLGVGRGDDVIKALNDRENGLAASDIPEADAARRIRALLQTKRVEEAKAFSAAWQGRSIDPLPKLAAAHRAYCLEGFKDEAAELAARVWELKVEDPQAPAADFIGFAEFLLAQDKNDQAFEILDRLLALRPDDAGAMISAAQAAEKYAQPDKALGYRDAAARLDPLDAGNRIRRIHDLALLGSFDQALSDLEAVLADKSAPRSVKYELIRDVGNWLGDEKNKGLAKNRLARLTSDAESAQEGREFFRLAAAVAADKARDAQTAKTMMEPANPSMPWFSASFAADFYRERRQYGQALEAINAGLRYFPADARLRLLAGRTWLDLGQPDQAIALALAGSDLMLAAHLTHFPPEADTLTDLLGADADPAAKIALAQGLAVALEKRKDYTTALALKQSLLSYVAPPEEGTTCAIVSGTAIEPGLAEELKQDVERLEKLQADKAREEEERLVILSRLDNGIDWSWLMPELRPQEVMLQGE